MAIEQPKILTRNFGNPAALTLDGYVASGGYVSLKKALAMEPGEGDVMSRPPRDPREAILSSSFLASILAYGALITTSTLAAYLWALRHEPHEAQTVAFMTLALAQTFHLGNARSVEAVTGMRRAVANPYALGAVGISIGLQLAAMYVDPLAGILHVRALEPAHWVVVIAL